MKEALVAGIVAIVAATTVVSQDEPAAKGPNAAQRGADLPNIVLVTSDDQGLQVFDRQVMPRTFERIVGPGTRFNSSYVAPPLCCPSRAGLITGQYPHNHGVFSNYPGYADLRDRKNVLPAWLGDAGYETAMIGKYLNGTESVHGTEPAPGWDRWVETNGNPTYYGGKLSVDGVIRKVGKDVYVQSLLEDYATQFVNEARKPFFLWFSARAPHTSVEPADTCEGNSAKPLPRDFRALRDLPFEPSAAFNERDVSDKPAKVQERKRLGKKEVAAVELAYRCAAASLRPVDRIVEKLWQEIVKRGEQDETIFIYTSDNGLQFGEHRIVLRKGYPYDESIRVPLAIRLPPSLATKGANVVSEPVANIDLAPTLLDLLGLRPCPPSGECRKMDGRSFTPLLEGRSRGWPEDRGILLEQDDSRCARGGIKTPRATLGVQLDRRVGGPGCVEVLADRELYLKRDRAQLDNRAGDSATARLEQKLRNRFEALRKCGGTSGPKRCE